MAKVAALRFLFISEAEPFFRNNALPFLQISSFKYNAPSLPKP